MKGYILNDQDLRDRFDYHSRQDVVSSIRDQLVLLKAMVEQRLNLAKNDAERITAFNAVTPAFKALDKLANSIIKIERSANEVLEKGAATKLAQDIVEILTDELKDVENRDALIDRIAKRIAQSVAEAKN